MPGWIKIERGMKNHWIFQDPEYLRAWIVLLLEVNYSPGKILIKRKLFHYERGESLKSLETWGTLFGGWSKKKVHTFFAMLKKENMIETQSETVTTRLKVLNYCKYQDGGNGNGTEMEQKGNARETHGKRTGDTDKKEKKDNKDKKKTVYPENFEKLWAIHRKGGKKEALKAYEKAKKDDLPDLDTLIKILKSHKAYWEKSGFEYHLSTWLNGGHWESDIEDSNTPQWKKELEAIPDL